MAATWRKRKGLKPEHILKKLEENTVVNGDKVSISSFIKVECQAALESMIDFGGNLSVSSRAYVLSKAIGEASKRKLNPENLILEVNNQLALRSAAKPQKFHLLTSISYAAPFFFSSFKVGSCEIRFFENFHPKKFAKHRNKLFNDRKIKSPESSFYCRVMVTTESNNQHEAAEECLNALNLFRAFLCLRVNSSFVISFGSISTNPINKIILGKYHTLHLANGQLASDTFWYEPNFKEIQAYRSNSDKEITLKSDLQWIFKRIEKFTSQSFKSSVIKTAVRFVNANDNTDHQSCIIMGWACLESLATNELESNNDLISRRCSFFFPDNQFHKQIIEHIREYRNNNVHYGESSYELSTMCYQIQRYFTNLIFFYLRNSNKFLSKDEANTFLDSPTNLKDLKRKAELINKAIKFRSPESES